DVLALRTQPSILETLHALRDADAPGAGPLSGGEPLAARAGIGPCGKLLACTRAAIDQILLEQAVEDGLVAVQAMGLPGGRRIPVHAQRFQLPQDGAVG